MTTEKNKIDFIVYWVDGNDEEWRKKKSNYVSNTNEDANINRYRDWENLVYIFRGIEKYASWVHKVYFISDGQIPMWMNIKHPKLKIVDHKDYIPQQYLPTFNANPIELNFHRIKDLSEQFVVFNDDFFILKAMQPTDFFVKGKPKDIIVEYPIMCSGENMIFSNMLCNDFNLLGKYYKRKQYKKDLIFKILNPTYGKYFFYNLLQYFIPYPKFFGILTPHFARPYLKSSFEELWKLEGEKLDNVCRNRFRNMSDVNIYIFRIWNLLKGNFVPGNIFHMGIPIPLKEDNEKIYQLIEEQKYKLICLNDVCKDSDFELVKGRIINSFQKILPDKSSFEI